MKLRCVYILWCELYAVETILIYSDYCRRSRLLSKYPSLSLSLSLSPTQRLRTENRLLKQRIETLEKVRDGLVFQVI